MSGNMIKTTTLAIVVFTNVVLGISTLPLVKVRKGYTSHPLIYIVKIVT